MIADSPADEGGIRHGDIILKVDDVEIKSAPQLRLSVSQMRPGRKVEVTLIRQGETLTLPVVLGSLNGSVASAESEQDVLDGVQLLSIDERLRKGWSLPEGVNGVGVGDVLPESPYSELLARGMVVVEVNGEAVTSIEELEAQLQVGANRLYIWSSGTNHFIALYIQED